MEGYCPTPKAHLLLAIEALLFAQERPAISEETHRKIGAALISARRDLVVLERQMNPSSRKPAPRQRR
jgi:hypothetical protein